MGFTTRPFPHHFRTLPRFPGGIAPLENVAHSEFQRVMFKAAFDGIRIDGIISPDVDYTESGVHTTIAGDSSSYFTSTRTGKTRAGALTNSVGTLSGALNPPFENEDGSDVPSVLNVDGSASDVYLVIELTYIGRNYPGFLRNGRAPGLVFCAAVRMRSSDAAAFIYASVSGTTPELFYGFSAPSGDNYFEIAEADAGTLFGITLKSKGWGYQVPHDDGTEIYTPSILAVEL